MRESGCVFVYAHDKVFARWKISRLKLLYRFELYLTRISEQRKKERKKKNLTMYVMEKRKKEYSHASYYMLDEKGDD